MRSLAGIRRSRGELFAARFASTFVRPESSRRQPSQRRSFFNLRSQPDSQFENPQELFEMPCDKKPGNAAVTLKTGTVASGAFHGLFVSEDGCNRLIGSEDSRLII
jgi:hypothetical protein